ncbi:MAG: transporter [Endozoicomonadaceae bacterium]|nr:transporter [Endozoicomonadaceae bacterium]
MLTCFFMSKKWAKWAWGGLICLIGLIIGDVYLSVLFNQWYKDFCDVLQTPKEISVFYDLIKMFFIITCTASLLHVLVRFLSNHFSLRWRQAMIQYYISKWAQITTEVYEGSSQRIQEDTRSFAQLIEFLGEEILRAILTLIAFIPILWPLSSYITFPGFNFPGVLVYCALLLSIGGLCASWFVGIKLPGLEYNNQKVEARFRKQLVYAEDDKKWANVLTLKHFFQEIKSNYSILYLHYTYFNLWRSLYYQITFIIPYLILIPALFEHIITLGLLVQIGKAFEKVQHSFSVLLDRWTQVTELRSVYKRLKEFESTLK